MIEAIAHEATGDQLDVNLALDDFKNKVFDKVHTLTGPIYVEETEIGDVLAVEL